MSSKHIFLTGINKTTPAQLGVNHLDYAELLNAQKRGIPVRTSRSAPGASSRDVRLPNSTTVRGMDPVHLKVGKTSFPLYGHPSPVHANQNMAGSAVGRSVPVTKLPGVHTRITRTDGEYKVKPFKDGVHQPGHAPLKRGEQVFTGPRGGLYHRSKNGTKVYIK